MLACLYQGIGTLASLCVDLLRIVVTHHCLVLRWFLATDERDPQALAVARAQNATLFSDLVESTPHLRRLLGWPMLYTDVLALVEQEIMARSAFFFAFAYSSVSGGVVNLRSVRGMDPRTMMLEGT
jgi:hypothetical protein